MPNPMNIRSVAPADFGRWQTLWQGYNLFYGRDALPTEITQMTWSRFLDPDEPVYAMVAETGGQLVGLVHFLSIAALFRSNRHAIYRTCSLVNRRGAKA